jgi:Tol biopolymer transport system component
MTARDDLDRTLSAWLTAQAPTSEPEHLLDHVLERTARTRRRPGWRIPERWIPMSVLTTTVAPRSMIPWRTVGLIALLVLALLAGALVAIGRAHRLPPPFGVAGNGSLVYSTNGDVVARSGPTGTLVSLVTGSDVDDTPILAPDGSKFTFLRHGPGDKVDLWVAAADGTGQRRLDLPFSALSWEDWSPSSDEVFVANENGETEFAIVPTDGSQATTIDLGVPVQVPMHRPNHPDQISFLGKDADGTRGFFLVGRDGRDPRRLDLDAGFRSDQHYVEDQDFYFQGQTWASDGTRLLYYTLEPAPDSPAGPGYRIHLAKIGLAGEVLSDDVLEYGAALDDEFAPGWLPTEDGIVFQTLEGTVHRIMTGGLEPGATAKDLGVQGTDWISSTISPDGREVVAAVPETGAAPPRVSIIDLAGGAITPLDIGADVSWQRVAP